MNFLSSRRNDLIAVLAVVSLAAFLIAVTRDSYTLLTYTIVPIWAVMGLSWNLLGGYLGLVSFGQAAFFGLGAFTVVILAHDLGVTPWIGLPLSALVGAAAAVIIGLVTFRFRGFYFALAMLAYPLALLYLFEWGGWIEVAIPMHREAPWAFMQFEDPRVLAWMASALFGFALFASLTIERSRFGLLLFAIRQDELAAQTAGIPAFHNKLKAIAISGVFASLAGGLYALVLLVVTPMSVFGMLVSAQALIISMFGGRGTAWGAAIGAAVLVPLSESLHAHFGASLPGIAGVVFGIAIIIVVVLIPNGVYWAFADWFKQHWTGRGAKIGVPSHVVSTAPVAPPPTALGRTSPALAPAGVEILAVRDVSIAFGGVTALQDVSFNIQSGEIVGIIGPNGAGKTTLFNVLSGLVRPDRGEAVFRSNSLIGRTPYEICELGIGRTFQTVRAFRRLTLLENVVTGAFVRFPDDTEAIGEAWNMLERVGLAGRALSMAAELNNRELRLMELARALSGRPHLVLLDECLAGLSVDDIDYMISVLGRLRDEGMTIAIIEHTMHAMAKLSDRLVVLDHGAVIAAGPPGEVLKHPDVIAAYLGKRWAERAC